MTRSPLQILVFPFIKEKDEILYALFKRKTEKYWQAIAGGGDNNETPIQAAMREVNEETGIPYDSKYLPLCSTATMPVPNVTGDFIWGPDILLIVERAFGVEMFNKDLALSDEHSEYAWVNYQKAMELLKWDSNKTALWELNHRLTNDVDINETETVLSTYLP